MYTDEGRGIAFTDKATAFVVPGDAAKASADGVTLDLSAVPSGGIGVGGHFVVECYNSDGELVWEDIAENGVTNVGIASLLNVYFLAATPITVWYIGLIDNASFVALAAADTMASHGGWGEVAGASYSQSTRVTWSPGSPSSGAIVNGTTADHSMINGSSLTVNGLFIVSDNTKGGTSGTLFSTASFTGGTQAVNNGDTLKVTYTMSAASA